ncbi:MAG TPA: Ku protein [Steroidobacteraceae bacterium]|nr:Ku protein [Steroidobacteraceae bacterium]
MPKPKKKTARKRAKPKDDAPESAGPSVRSFWSGTITFGLVSIPVDLVSAVRARQTALKLVDKDGHPLGRQYHCSKDGKPLGNEDLVRGYETEDGQMIAITDEEFESVAPEMSSDIELRNFVPAEQIPPLYFQKSYFLAPAGKSSKAYNLLAATMARSGRVGIGNFVMRAHEYLVAIVSDNGVLRADTLRYADEIRTPDSIGLPKRVKAPAQLANQFSKEIEGLKSDKLSMVELEDKEAERLQALVKEKQKDSANVIQQRDLEAVDDEAEAGEEGEGAQIIDLMARLRQSLSTRAVVTNAASSAPISLAERRALKQEQSSAKAVTSQPVKSKPAKSKKSKPRKSAKKS